MAPPHFTSQPPDRWTGKNNRPNVGQNFIREQANYVYKKTELGEVTNTETLQQ